MPIFPTPPPPPAPPGISKIGIGKNRKKLKNDHKESA